MTRTEVTDATNTLGEPIVVVDIEERVMTIRMNRPERLNGLGKSMREALGRALEVADEDDEVRCVVLTGTGRAFSSGADLAEGGMGPTGTYDWYRFHDGGAYGKNAAVDVRGFRKPVIAAVNGFCLGGGCDLSMVCDFTLAAESA